MKLSKTSGPLALAAIAFCGAGSFASAQTERVDVTFLGTEADRGVGFYQLAFSRNARFVVFESESTNLLAHAWAGPDLYLRDRERGTVELVAPPLSGVPPKIPTLGFTVSDDGRFVAFATFASAYIVGDTNLAPDVYVRDRANAVTFRASVDSSGAQSNGASTSPALSGDGRFLAFESLASNLVAGDTNGASDVFVRDLVSNTTTRVVSSLGREPNGASSSPSFSFDGRFLVFVSAATNLALVPDTNGMGDVFRLDRTTGGVELASLASSGAQASDWSFAPSISDDGSRVAFWSAASNLAPNDANHAPDVFVRDFATAATKLVSANAIGASGSGSSVVGNISRDGRFVAFESDATDLVFGDSNGLTDAFVADLALDRIVRVSVDSARHEGDGASNVVRVGEPGFARVELAYLSTSDDLVVGDLNSRVDVFVANPSFAVASPSIYCTAKTNSLGCVPAIGFSGSPSISGFDDFFVTASNVVNRRIGMLLWSRSSAAIPFGGGTLCLAAPLVRSALENSGGSASSMLDCTSGFYSFRFAQSVFASFGVSAGDTLFAQFWSRDPGFVAPNDVGLTNALRFTLGV